MSRHEFDKEAVYRLRARMLTGMKVHSTAAPPVPMVDPERTRPGNDLPYESHHSSFDRKIVLITAAFLLLLLGLLLLHCLVRCIMRRLYHPPSPTIPDQHPPHPMKKRQIQSLPSFTFHHPSTHEAPSSCPICLADFTEGDLIRLLPTCHHGFHASCVDSWFLRQATCPTCRADLLKGEERSRSVEVHVVIMPTGELCPTLSGEAKDHSSP